MPINLMTYDLCFSKKDRYQDHYGATISKIKPQNYNTFIDDMVREAEKVEPNFSQLIEVEVDNKWFCSPRQLLTLDVDSPDSLELARISLADMNIQHYVIESSPNHYWIICAKVGRIKELLKIARAVRGVDQEYIEGAKRENAFLLRAFPRSIPEANTGASAVKPRFTSLPQLLEKRPTTTAKDFKLFKYFLTNFHRYWHDNINMDHICREINGRYRMTLLAEKRAENENPISKKVEQKKLEPENLVFDDSILSQLEL